MTKSNTYHKDYQRKRYAERKAKAIEHLGCVCVVCGSEDDLQFDHVDPETKSCNVSPMLSKRSWKAILEELNKCQLLCIDCHQEKTTTEASDREPWNKGTGKKHGSYHGVYTLKCKCPECSDYKERRLEGRRRP